MNQPLQEPDPPIPAPLLRTHLIHTRAQDDFFKLKHPPNIAHIAYSALFSVLHATSEPRGFKSAAKSPHWMAAIDAELKALTSNQS